MFTISSATQATTTAVLAGVMGSILVKTPLIDIVPTTGQNSMQSRISYESLSALNANPWDVVPSVDMRDKIYITPIVQTFGQVPIRTNDAVPFKDNQGNVAESFNTKAAQTSSDHSANGLGETTFLLKQPAVGNSTAIGPTINFTANSGLMEVTGNVLIPPFQLLQAESGSNVTFKLGFNSFGLDLAENFQSSQVIYIYDQISDLPSTEVSASFTLKLAPNVPIAQIRPYIEVINWPTGDPGLPATLLDQPSIKVTFTVAMNKKNYPGFDDQNFVTSYSNVVTGTIFNVLGILNYMATPNSNLAKQVRTKMSGTNFEEFRQVENLLNDMRKGRRWRNVSNSDQRLAIIKSLPFKKDILTNEAMTFGIDDIIHGIKKIGHDGFDYVKDHAKKALKSLGHKLTSDAAEHFVHKLEDAVLTALPYALPAVLSGGVAAGGVAAPSFARKSLNSLTSYLTPGSKESKKLLRTVAKYLTKTGDEKIKELLKSQEIKSYIDAAKEGRILQNLADGNHMSRADRNRAMHSLNGNGESSENLAFWNECEPVKNYYRVKNVEGVKIVDLVDRSEVPECYRTPVRCTFSPVLFLMKGELTLVGFTKFFKTRDVLFDHNTNRSTCVVIIPMEFSKCENGYCCVDESPSTLATLPFIFSSIGIVEAGEGYNILLSQKLWNKLMHAINGNGNHWMYFDFQSVFVPYVCAEPYKSGNFTTGGGLLLLTMNEKLCNSNEKIVQGSSEKLIHQPLVPMRLFSVKELFNEDGNLKMCILDPIRPITGRSVEFAVCVLNEAFKRHKFVFPAVLSGVVERSKTNGLTVEKLGPYIAIPKQAAVRNIVENLDVPTYMNALKYDFFLNSKLTSVNYYHEESSVMKTYLDLGVDPSSVFIPPLILQPEMDTRKFQRRKEWVKMGKTSGDELDILFELDDIPKFQTEGIEVGACSASQLVRTNGVSSIRVALLFLESSIFADLAMSKYKEKKTTFNSHQFKKSALICRELGRIFSRTSNDMAAIVGHAYFTENFAGNPIPKEFSDFLTSTDLYDDPLYGALDIEGYARLRLLFSANQYSQASYDTMMSKDVIAVFLSLTAFNKRVSGDQLLTVQEVDIARKAQQAKFRRPRPQKPATVTTTTTATTTPETSNKTNKNNNKTNNNNNNSGNGRNNTSSRNNNNNSYGYRGRGRGKGIPQTVPLEVTT
jgi:hypothetical protein